MVRITENSLSIHIDHPCPKELCIEIQQSIFNALQHISHESLEKEELKDTYYFLLLLLKETMQEKE